MGALRQKDGDLVLTPEVLHAVSLEIPAINQSYATKKYKYFWGSHGDLSKAQGKVGKLDVDTQELKTWGDDGVNVASCLHGGNKDRNKITIVVLNAADMTEIARSTFTSPSDTPRSLHGTYVPA